MMLQMRSILYSCDAKNMYIHTNSNGEKAFGVTADFVLRTTPFIRANVDGLTIEGCFGATLLSPWKNISTKDASKFKENDSSTWVYKTESPLNSAL